MSASKIVSEIAATMRGIEETEFFKFIDYLIDKNGEERKLSAVREKFPALFTDINDVQFLVEHEIFWIEMDGKVHPGRLSEALYSAVSKMRDLAKKE